MPEHLFNATFFACRFVWQVLSCVRLCANEFYDSAIDNSIFCHQVNSAVARVLFAAESLKRCWIVALCCCCVMNLMMGIDSSRILMCLMNFDLLAQVRAAAAAKEADARRAQDRSDLYMCLALRPLPTFVTLRMHVLFQIPIVSKLP